MKLDQNKFLEQEFGREFLNQLNPYLISMILKRDEEDPVPDILLMTQPGTGIEITQISNTLIDGRPRMQFEGSMDFLLKKMENLWIEMSYPPAHVIIYLDNGSPISKNDSTPIASQIVEYLKDYIPPEGQVFYSKEEMLISPDILKYFIIERIVRYDQILFSYFDHIWSPTLTTLEIQKVIDRKEIKRERIYHKSCEVIWLLIVLYSGKASGNFLLPEEVFENKYYSNFDKVFLFDAVPKKFWELSIVKD